MSSDLIVHEDHTTVGNCRGEDCQWWVMDYVEERGALRFDCALVILAKGLTTEALAKSPTRG